MRGGENMKNNNFLHLLIAFVVGGLVVWVVSNMIQVENNNALNYRENRGTMMGDNIDKHFIEGMIPHHDGAIKMAELALERTRREEIKTLSENIISSQTFENVQMREWYKQWFGKEVEDNFSQTGYHGGMMMGMMDDEDDLKSLENAANFDKKFIEEMIPHHQMAVMMAEMLKSGTQRDEMKKLADDIIKAQTEEIDMMRAWYKDWGYSTLSE